MPITRSAKKALRQSLTRRAANTKRRDAFKEHVKQVRKLLSQKKVQEAAELLPKTYQALDKAAKSGVIKKNTAARVKSRLTKLVQKPATS
ncbi:MAG: 30S ribosomal protein S20 [Candidatus Sungbacteria bacterium RIFCSPLOWO2_02_FULL_51_17]|uniref:Small ribosomal subunit protein bS20 n=1 Tax=Candidatus Sungbacteria bacterium RIFCSPHIGHO2_02_FULL_51_29 TaxID=1802273 RepID=A0A1G2KPB2_9BACT|nr:MAG: 30S ribosomal protein S20 [Candidatus Sungbacteria bacterium RIFCSPHIGHO2_01_FULL_51_22]OHA01247.1 MAG: 30S ribosomal protein S20 [Candidatus Sungbacteria bacterium RIFCSPHIGHO2_02_FULL_51_29]OHA05866.1 MAG: 30S ribosomal protein S20 [Candidatus Sungbacteria bacterium RIFCSPLOWO2_01_FULL_51_34]OHA11369.1 MAG: 30S ribosomal protein S20 [Candidatus Sungbacteria bacterium RIFCSPLOWO2_02_FULL_51_17]